MERSPRQRRQFKKAIGLVALALSVGACAQDVGDIDRTQPNKIQKSAFEGQWYSRQTVVDINGTGTSTFIGNEGDPNRVTFDFSENALIARRTHEDVLGIDAPADGVPDDTATIFDAAEDGSPVIAFGIDHFDVQRVYNSATGEQSNVIVENRSDRPWFEREWIRIRWSDPAGALPSWDGILGNARYGHYEPPQDSTEEPDWYVECQEKGSEKVVDCSDEDAEVTYLDVTYTMFRQSSFNECLTLFFSLPGLFNADCGTERIKMRASFAKIRDLDIHGECEDCDQTFTLQNDYKPREYDDFDDKRFGFFRMNRAVYDRRFGLRDYAVKQYAQLRSIWHRYEDKDGNPLHPRDRVPKPIAYYVNADHPVDLLDEMALISEDYDMAFRRIVFAASNAGGPAKYASIEDVPRMFYICNNPGPSPDFTLEDPSADELARLDNLGPMFAKDRENLLRFYEQSNEGYSTGVCKRPGTRKEMGDVRYSFFNFINTPNYNGPLGYGPSSADPLTGELYNGSSNAYGAAIDTQAQYLLDLINVINGDLEPEDIGYGANARTYFDQLRERAEPTRAQALEVTRGADGAQLAQAPLTASKSDVRAVTRQQERLAKLQETMERKAADPHLQEVLSRGPDSFRLQSDFQRNPNKVFEDTPVEQKLIFPEIVEAANKGMLDPQTLEAGDDSAELPSSLDTSLASVLSFISPLRGMSASAHIQEANQLDLKLLKKRVHMADDSLDPRYMGWAREGRELRDALIDRGVDPYEVQLALWYWVRGKAYLGLQEHEVGHSLGLRHNFAGSTDALNYFPQYWSLRQKTFEPDCTGQGFQTFDPTGLATRQTAPTLCAFGSEITPSAETHAANYALLMSGGDASQGWPEFAAGLETYQTASIMEYGSVFGLNDQAGLGLYDYAALAYAYGDLVEVFNQPPNKIEYVENFQNGSFQQIGSTFGRSDAKVTNMQDVDDYVRIQDGERIEDAPLEDERERYGYRGLRDNPWNYWHYSVLPIMFFDDTHTPTDEQVQDLHLSPRVDFSHIGGMWKLYDRSLVPREEAEAQELVQVPYKYCEDLFAGQSDYDCMRWDTGADNFEVLTNIIERYDAYYPINNFRRGRLAYGMTRSFRYVAERVFGRALKAYQFWLLDASARGVGWYTNPYGGGSTTMAAIDGINFLGGIMTRPAIGTYALSSEDGLYTNFDTNAQGIAPENNNEDWDFSDDQVFTIDLSNGGRYQFDQFVQEEDGERPYYFPFMLETSSHFWHKVFAMQVLVEGSISVLGADTTSNITSFFIQPTIVFKDELFRFFSGMITEDFDKTVGICVKVDDQGHVETHGDKDRRIIEWKPMELTAALNARGCERGYAVANPYTAAFGNNDFNSRYFATLVAAQSFLGNLDYDWIDTAGLYIKGRGETPELSDELAGVFEAREFTDALGISNGQTYVAFCPIDYIPGRSTPLRHGCELINQMQTLHDTLRIKRIESALAAGRIDQAQVGDDPLDPVDAEAVDAAARAFSPTDYAEYFQLQSSQEMARFHLEILSRIY